MRHDLQPSRRSHYMCNECVMGRHKHASPLGCLRTVAPEPRDYVCICGWLASDIGTGDKDHLPPMGIVQMPEIQGA